MKYHRSQKDVLIGIAVGLIVNILGMLLWWLIFSKSDLETTFVYAYEEGMLGAIIGLGAILNLLAFFAFIRLRQDSRAKGVLIATFISAFIILFLKFW